MLVWFGQELFRHCKILKSFQITVSWEWWNSWMMRHIALESSITKGKTLSSASRRDGAPLRSLTRNGHFPALISLWPEVESWSDFVGKRHEFFLANLRSSQRLERQLSRMTAPYMPMDGHFWELCKSFQITSAWMHLKVTETWRNSKRRRIVRISWSWSATLCFAAV